LRDVPATAAQRRTGLVLESPSQYIQKAFSFPIRYATDDKPVATKDLDGFDDGDVGIDHELSIADGDASGQLFDFFSSNKLQVMEYTYDRSAGIGQVVFFNVRRDRPWGEGVYVHLGNAPRGCGGPLFLSRHVKLAPDTMWSGAPDKLISMGYSGVQRGGIAVVWDERLLRSIAV